MKIVILGCPGAGKGTQAKILCQKYGLSHLSTGDIFRAEIEKKTALGEKVQSYVQKGLLVPDGLVVEIVAARVGQEGCLFDGFPRTLEQARELDKVLSGNGQGIDLVAYLAMDEKEVVRRLTGRRTCTKCAAVYNTVSAPSAQEGVCDACGGTLVQRGDDSEVTVKKRMMVYEDQTRPLVSYYKSEKAFAEVDGGQSPEAVTRGLVSAIDRAMAAEKRA